MEGKSDEELEYLKEEFERLQARASKKLEARAQRKVTDVIEPPCKAGVSGE